MDNVTIASTPNWFLNQVICVNYDCSLVAYCVRTEVVVMKNAYASNVFGIDYKTIHAAHKDRAAGCVFSPVTDPNKPFYKHLVSFGDDGAIKIWNLTNGKCIMVNNAHTKQIESGHKLVGVDWLKTDPHVIVSVSDNSVVVRWALESNTAKQFVIRVRLFPQCIAASPHDKDIVAIGSKCGHIMVFSMKSGTLLGRVRCGDNDIMSLSWCPDPSDVIYKINKEPKYLVAGTKDYSVFIIKTNHTTSKQKNDCAQFVANVFLPRSTMNKNNTKFTKTYKKDYGWSVVCWSSPNTILTTSRFAEVISFQTESMHPIKDGLQFKYKLIHDRHTSKPIFSLACPQITEENSSIDQVVWTIAVDRHLIRHSLRQLSLSLDLHTCTSYVYTLALSIVPDQSRLAIGLGEGKILIWNMFKTSFLDMAEYWQKIEGKVMTLAFHPAKEGWLGYGTSYGSVGILDIASRNKSPFITYSLEKTKLKTSESEKMAVYKLCWGPNFLPVEDNASKEPYCMYGVSNGDLFMFTPSSKAFKATPPISLKPYLDKIDTEAGLPENSRRCDISWKPDFSSLAVANESGAIYILSSNMTWQLTLLEHKKLINTMAWHPDYIMSGVSPYKNWLATGSNSIKVFNIDPDNMNLSRQPIATLSLHSQRITCVAWNPHVNGQLLSTSYDHVAQVWDVVNQTPLVSYHGHISHVMSGLWSPLDPNVVITSSADGTVQSWKMSNQTTTRPSDKKKKNDSSSAPVATFDVDSDEIITYKDEPSYNNSDRKKQKSVFPITGVQLSYSSHLKVLVNRYVTSTNPDQPIVVDYSNNNNIEKDKVSHQNGFDVVTINKNEIDKESEFNNVDEIEKINLEKNERGSLYLNFFGTREDMSDLVQKELNQHLNNKYITGAIGTSLWLGDFNKVVKMAMEKEELSDEIVALSQTASLKLWRDCCEAYAKQLISEGNVLKATNYLLAIHKIEEAVSLLLKNNSYKEALSLAKLRLPDNHELVKSGYKQWAEHAALHGNYDQAAHMYLVLGDGVAAMQILNKSNDPKLQHYACILALNNSSMSNTAGDMLNNCFKRCLEKVPLTAAKEVIDTHPQKKHFALWYYGRQRCSEMLETQKYLSSWSLTKEDKRNILEKIAEDVKDIEISSTDVDILRDLVNTCEGMDKTKVLVYISGHLGIASVSSSVERLRHILLALKVAYKFQSRSIVFPASFNAALYPSGPLETYPLLEKTKSDNADFTQSIRAFFCDSVINWLYYCEDKNLAQDKVLDILEHTIENYIQDVISIDTVQYYKAQHDIATLENALCQQIVKDNIINRVDSVENLSLFKNKENQKIQTGGLNGLDENEMDAVYPEENGIDNKDQDNVEKEQVDETGAKKAVEKRESEVNEEDTKINIVKEIQNDANNGNDEKIENSIDTLQDFEKATNPKYDLMGMAVEGVEKEEDEELQTADGKVQRLKELKETVLNFERSRIYSPNPSNVFDLIFKVLKTLNSDESEARRRINELSNLMNTHAEAFELA